MWDLSRSPGTWALKSGEFSAAGYRLRAVRRSPARFIASARWAADGRPPGYFPLPVFNVGLLNCLTSGTTFERALAIVRSAGARSTVPRR